VIQTRVGDVIVIGLTKDELEQLSKGCPQLVQGESLGLPPRIAIVAGETNGAIIDEMRKAGVPIPEGEPDEAGGVVPPQIAELLAATIANKRRAYLGRPLLPLPDSTTIKTIDQIGKMACPTCGLEADSSRAQIVGERMTVVPGDWFLCQRCGSAAVFDAELKGRPATQEDIDKLRPEHQAQLKQMTDEIVKRRCASKPTEWAGNLPGFNAPGPRRNALN
jgi:hypothetical protein